MVLLLDLRGQFTVASHVRLGLGKRVFCMRPVDRALSSCCFGTALGLGIPSLKWILLFPCSRKETEAQSGVTYRS